MAGTYRIFFEKYETPERRISEAFHVSAESFRGAYKQANDILTGMRACSNAEIDIQSIEHELGGGCPRCVSGWLTKEEFDAQFSDPSVTNGKAVA
ncbi:hypothetical protein [Hoeflea sp. TYP-13]|uniref:hypothetical protein n=1 Tax=Hoeflea sp. TYP-13 TaxID=3230023 RepID=UPI0034C66EC9